MMLLRLVGQRESGGLGLTDLLVVVLVADAASAGLTGDVDSIPDGLLLVATILFWSVALDAVAYRWPRVGAIIKARPRPLIQDGRLDDRVMRREFRRRCSPSFDCTASRILPKSAGPTSSRTE
jgi:uncharacterized membrane protein YcaP (DUF421 family)